MKDMPASGRAAAEVVFSEIIPAGNYPAQSVA
jgi:hypothetical protein